jgi:uncharacterized protein YigE (DUF2233 family)
VKEVVPSSVRVIWKDEEGRALRNYAAAARYLEAGGLEVELLMNGGIFEPGGVPSGLLVHGGRELKEVNREEGRGNFFFSRTGFFWSGLQGQRWWRQRSIR